MSKNPSPVGQLARELPINRPALSQHLKVLKEAGLVFDRQTGTRHVYRVDPKAVEALGEYFNSFWRQALASSHAHASARACFSAHSAMWLTTACGGHARGRRVCGRCGR
jgi:DNA-binding IclR family transcriptional regulator